MIFDKVKKLCDERKITIARLERELGLSQGGASKWKKSTPSAETLAKLSEYFDVPIEYFLESGNITAPEQTMKNIVERIKKRRTELGYSFQYLASLTGMSKSTLQRYETGAIQTIALDKLEILSNALKVSPEWIMGWNKNFIINIDSLSGDRKEFAEIIKNIYFLGVNSDEETFKVVFKTMLNNWELLQMVLKK